MDNQKVHFFGKLCQFLMEKFIFRPFVRKFHLVLQLLCFPNLFYSTKLRCPMRRQNIDYAHFLLTALYHESHHTEPWEHSQIAELLEMRERERLEAESEPESPAQAELMMKASERRSNGEEAAAK